MSLKCSDCKKRRSCTSSRKGPHTRCFQPEGESRADRIRAMTDEELAEFLNRCVYRGTGTDYCRGLRECREDLERDTMIPLERCAGCFLLWLREPAKEESRLMSGRR